MAGGSGVNNMIEEKMKHAVIALTLALTLTGCADLDPVMGRTEGTPVPAPSTERAIDCDLIFPGGADRR